MTQNCETSPKPEVHLELWSDVSVPKVMMVLVQIINMGLIPLPNIKDYWFSDRKMQIKFFGDVMSRDCILQIFWMMHVGK
jgi:hypothetical protein